MRQLVRQHHFQSLRRPLRRRFRQQNYRPRRHCRHLQPGTRSHRHSRIRRMLGRRCHHSGHPDKSQQPPSRHTRHPNHPGPANQTPIVNRAILRSHRYRDPLNLQNLSGQGNRRRLILKQYGQYQRLNQRHRPHRMPIACRPSPSRQPHRQASRQQQRRHPHQNPKCQHHRPPLRAFAISASIRANSSGDSFPPSSPSNAAIAPAADPSKNVSKTWRKALRRAASASTTGKYT